MDNVWCAICHYQYAELADLKKRAQFRSKYSVEVLYVLPYAKDSVAKWTDSFQDRMNAFERWRNPKEPDKLTDGQRSWMEYCRVHFPNRYEHPAKNFPLPFPAPMDTEQTVSQGFEILTQEWDETKTMQNIPTFYIIDKSGIIRFKYHRQSTTDRPNAEYLIEFLKRMM